MAHPNASRFFIHTLHKVSRSGRTRGDPTYTLADQVAFKGYLKKKTALIRNADGDIAETQYVLATDVDIKLDDKIWFPAIGGEAADDLTDLNDARRPKNIDEAESTTGAGVLYEVMF